MRDVPDRQAAIASALPLPCNEQEFAMTVLQVLNFFRLALGIALLIAGVSLGWLSLGLLDMGNFRTEGSPAGTIMFVLLLGAPVAAVGALLGGVFLIGMGWVGRHPPAPDPNVFAPRTPPAQREELWRKHATGGRLGALVNGDLSVLLHQPGTGMTAARTHNASYRGSANATYPFRCSDGRLLQLPVVWAVPSALALRALDHFAEHGELAKFLGWEAVVAGSAQENSAKTIEDPWHSLGNT